MTRTDYDVITSLSIHIPRPGHGTPELVPHSLAIEHDISDLMNGYPSKVYISSTREAAESIRPYYDVIESIIINIPGACH
jgi:hypothetical protein